MIKRGIFVAVMCCLAYVYPKAVAQAVQTEIKKCAVAGNIEILYKPTSKHRQATIECNGVKSEVVLDLVHQYNPSTAPNGKYKMNKVKRYEN